MASSHWRPTGAAKSSARMGEGQVRGLNGAVVEWGSDKGWGVDQAWNRGRMDGPGMCCIQRPDRRINEWIKADMCQQYLTPAGTDLS